MKRSVAKLGNYLYAWAPGLYGPLYSLYKAVSDRYERSLIARYVGEGSTVIDVGANIGVYTRYFADLVGERGRVTGIEPDAENFRRLTGMVGALPQVTVFHAAAAEQEGVCRLYLSDNLNVDHQTYDSGESRAYVDVRALALDDLFPAGTRVDFIKMDIQGAEPIAMRGATRIMAENPGLVMLFEYWPYGIRRSGNDPEQFLASLRAQSLVLQPLGRDPAAPFGDGEDDYYNIIAARAERLTAPGVEVAR